MPDLKISQFTNRGTAQVPTDVVPLVVGSAAPNYKITLNDLFADLARNTTDKGIALTGVATGSAPAVSAVGQAKFYFNTTLNKLLLSREGAAYQEVLCGSPAFPLAVSNATGQLTISGPLAPLTAGSTTVGTSALPFSSLYLGNAATNNIQFTGTATAARTATFPDASGTVAYTSNIANVWKNTIYSNDYADLNTALAAGASHLVVTQAGTLTADAAVDAEDWLEVAGNGAITLGNFNLTIKGTFTAPVRQVFFYTGTGRVRFEGNSQAITQRTWVVHPEWWGAIPGDGIDDLAGCQAAVDSFTSEGYGKIVLSGLYTLSNSLDFSMSAADYRGFHFGLTVEGGEGGQSLVRGRCGFEWKGASTGTAIKAWSRDLRFRNFTVRTASGFFMRAAFSFDQPSGSATVVSANTLQNVAVTTHDNAQLKNMVVAMTGSSTTITVPSIAGTWTNSGSTLVGSGGAALTDVRSGEYLLVNGTQARVLYASDNNTIVLEAAAPTITGAAITHNKLFAAGDVGKWIVLGDGGSAGIELPFFAQITGFTSTTQATISIAAARTATCVRASLSPVGAGLEIGNTATANNDNHTIEDNTVMTDVCIGMYISSTTAQVKQIRLWNTRFGINGFGIFLVTGSFEARGMAFANNWLADVGDSTAQECKLIDGAHSEGSSALWRSYNGGTSPDPIQISNYRWESSYGENDGYIITYPRSGTLNLLNVSVGSLAAAQARYKVRGTGADFICNMIGGTWTNTTPVSSAAASPTINLIGVRGWSGAALADIPNALTGIASSSATSTPQFARVGIGTAAEASQLVVASGAGEVGVRFRQTANSSNYLRFENSLTGVQTDLVLDSAGNFIFNNNNNNVYFNSLNTTFFRINGSNVASLSATNFSPTTAAALTLGTGALPFSSIFIGGAATNNIQITGTATAARVATFPDATTTLAGLAVAQTFTAAQTISSTSANALAVGANGATNPVLQLDGSTASVATGIKITGRAAGDVEIAVISPNADENLYLTPKGSGAVIISLAGNQYKQVWSNGTVTSALWVGGTDSAIGTSSAHNFFHFFTNNVDQLFLTTAGNLGLGTATFGTSAARVLGLFNATSPGTSPADMVQLYAADIAAGQSALHIRDEGGSIYKIGGGALALPEAANLSVGTTTGTKIGTATTQKLGFWNATPVVRPAAYVITNVTTDRVLDANATTLDEVADVLGTLIADLQSIGLIG